MITAAMAMSIMGLLAGSPADAVSERPTPVPVYAPPGPAADPGVITDGERYYAFLTGGLGRMATAETLQGKWTAQRDALSRWPGWASGKGAVWAGDAMQTSVGWVYYMGGVIAKDFGGQRCIGTAVAAHPSGPYEPSDHPLICPVLGGEDPAEDRPVPGSGMIDASPFVDDDGTRYLLYKTQRAPGTVRMVQLTDDGLHTAGPSRELLRRADSIEGPVMVKRGGQYVLFTSVNWYDQCRYSTVWRRSTDLWSFADKPEHVLLDQANTGLCGPGGSDVVTTDADENRIILHGWVCDAANTPCEGEGRVVDPNRRRVLYAAVLTWGDDGATPYVPAFLRPANANGES